ncbi:MAG: hypothetical protein ABUL62_32175 [Myxococcales bacterium]
MPKKRTSSAPLALTLDGSLLLDESAQLEPSLVSQVAAALSVAPSTLFIGTRLPAPELAEALSRVDDAAAEAAARIQALRLRAKSSTRGRSRKTYKKV